MFSREASWYQNMLWSTEGRPELDSLENHYWDILTDHSPRFTWMTTPWCAMMSTNNHKDDVLDNLSSIALSASDDKALNCDIFSQKYLAAKLDCNKDNNEDDDKEKVNAIHFRLLWNTSTIKTNQQKPWRQYQQSVTIRTMQRQPWKRKVSHKECRWSCCTMMTHWCDMFSCKARRVSPPTVSKNKTHRVRSPDLQLA